MGQADNAISRTPMIIQPRVLLIEDEQAVAASLRLAIDRAGMVTEWAASGLAAIEMIPIFVPNVVLVDLELPDTNGNELVRWMRDNHDCGIIIVTGNAQEAERIISLEVGADDYITKPPSIRELVARIRAVHRRTVGRTNEMPVDGVAGLGGRRNAANRITFTIRGITVDLQQRRAIDAGGRAVDVTAAEFAVLEALADANGEAVSREALSLIALRRVWHAEDRSIDQLIFQLRTKISPGDKDHHVIQTVRGAGYRLVLPQ